MEIPLSGHKKLVLPGNYKPLFSIMEAEHCIKDIKDHFERALAERLNLIRVSAPLFVRLETGLNDNLSGVERPVEFDILDCKCNVQIVQSLAKWKRSALKRYGFSVGTGLYTDMNAIRRDETLDNLHSIYVDQWDWEKVIDESQRNIETMKQVVVNIVAAIADTEVAISKKYKQIKPYISKDVFFMTTQELEDMYPRLSPKEREHAICKEHSTVYLMQIGDKLKSGNPHDSRSPDYDDWSMNGDILIWFPPLNRSLELSSMGIRVDPKTLKIQLEKSNCMDRAKLSYHAQLLNGELPLTIGGGIGQSRLCMAIMQCVHIGEVQASIWPRDMIRDCAEKGITLL